MNGKLRIDWSAAEGEPVRPVTHFVAQAGQHDYILTLGFIAPPIILDSDDQDRVKAMENIPVNVVARVLLTPAGMRALADVLLENIAARKERETKK